MAKVIKPNVVRGGRAIPLGNNYYYMQGRKHSQGGIDIGENDKDGLEVEGGEVMKVSPKSIKVYSSVPFLHGKSPAQLVMGGANPTKVFDAQEEFKDRNKINDDGTKAALGKEKENQIDSLTVDKLSDSRIDNFEETYYDRLEPIEIVSKGKRLPKVSSRAGNKQVIFYGNRISNGDMTLEGVPDEYKSKVSEYLKGQNFGRKVAAREGYEELNKFANAATGGVSGFASYIGEKIGSSIADAVDLDEDSKIRVGLEIAGSIAGSFVGNPVTRTPEFKKTYHGSPKSLPNGKPVAPGDKNYVAGAGRVQNREIGVYTSPKKSYAERYMSEDIRQGLPPTEDARLYEYFVNAEKLHKSKTWTGLDKLNDEVVNYSNIRKAQAKALKRQGYNGVSFNAAKHKPEIVVFDSKDLHKNIPKVLHENFIPNALITSGNTIKVIGENNKKFKYGGNMSLIELNNNGKRRMIYTPSTGRSRKLTGGQFGLIGDVIKLGTGIGSYIYNNRMIKKRADVPEPNQLVSNKLKTRVNINPQLDALRENKFQAYRDANETASSKSRAARRGLARLQNSSLTNQLYGQKENMETELINRDRINQQQVTNQNITNWNRRNEAQQQEYNNRLVMRAKNFDDLMAGVDNFVTNIDDKYQEAIDKRNYMASRMATNPNVDMQRLYDLGYGDNLSLRDFLGIKRKRAEQVEQRCGGLSRNRKGLTKK